MLVRRRNYGQAIGRTASKAIRYGTVAYGAYKGTKQAIKAANNIKNDINNTYRQGKRLLEDIAEYMPKYKKSKKYGKVSKRRGRAPRFSKSAGKLYSRRPIRSNKFRKTIDRRGVEFRLEDGGTPTAKLCHYIGHCTLPKKLAVQQFVRAMLKALWSKRGLTLNSFQGVVTQNGAITGDLVSIYWKNNYLESTTQGSWDYSINLADTFETLVDYFDDLIEAKTDQFFLTEIRYQTLQDTALWQNIASINLSTAKIMIWTKSTLKVQNRSTPNDTDDQADDVDNIPLYGKSYYGHGSGLRYIVQPSTALQQFVCSALTGTLNMAVNSYTDPNGFLAEPPQPSRLLGCKKFGKVKLDPGEVKTSTLGDKFQISVSKFLQYFCNTLVSSTTYYQRGMLGKNRVFALEKMMEVNNSEPRDMTFGYEHDLKIGMFLKYINDNRTTPILAVS